MLIYTGARGLSLRPIGLHVAAVIMGCAICDIFEQSGQSACGDAPGRGEIQIAGIHALELAEIGIGAVPA